MHKPAGIGISDEPIIWLEDRSYGANSLNAIIGTHSHFQLKPPIAIVSAGDDLAGSGLRNYTASLRVRICPHGE